MIVNTLLGFTLKRTFSSILLTKIDSDNIKSVHYQILEKIGCESTYSKITDKIEVNVLVNILLPKQNGTYLIKIDSKDVQGQITSKSYIFENYYSLLQDVVKEIKNKSCISKQCLKIDCQDNYKHQETTLLKTLSYFLLNQSYYNTLLESSIKCINCDLGYYLNCLINTEKIKGISEDKGLSNTILLYMYYSLYLGEKVKYDCCSDEIENFFNIKELKSCLRDIDLDCIYNSFRDNPKYMEQVEYFKEL